MPDLQNFSVIRAASKQLTVPTWDISGQIVDSKTGALVRDFSGANLVSFPQVLAQLTQAQQDDLVSNLVLELLHKRFGIQ